MRQRFRQLRQAFLECRTHRFGKSCERILRIHNHINKGVQILLQQIQNTLIALTLALRLVIGDDIGIHHEVCEQITHLRLRRFKTCLRRQETNRTRDRTFDEDHLTVQLFHPRTHHGRMEIAHFFASKDIVTRIRRKQRRGNCLIHRARFCRVITLQRIRRDRTQHCCRHRGER